MWLILNQYSYVVIGLVVLTIVTFLSWRLIGIKYAIPLAALTIGLLITFQLILSTNTVKYSSIDDFENSLTSGEPVLVMLYSDF
jgi:hypothetical protein